MEPHAPYEPPEPFRSRYGREVPGAPDIETANQDLIRRPFAKLAVPEVELLESYYDGEVAAVDAELRQLFDELRQRRFLDNAIVVITADHGEEFLDHGRVSHGTSLYNETIRVPLLLQGTGIPSGRVVTENVSLVDVAPTLLDLAGLPPEPNFEGRSLAPLITPPSAPAGRRDRLPGDPPGESRDILAELERTDTKLDFRRHTSSILRGSVKLLVNQPHATAETYDLAEDPRERTPLASEDGKAAAVLARALEELRASLQIRRAELAERGRVDEATREKLRALGYEP
jgi:arylsulfatase A-like enzyme